MKMNRMFKLTVLVAAALFFFPPAASGQTELISGTASWDYLHPTNGVDPATQDPTGDFATTWYEYTSYDGPAFTTAKPGPFFYGAIDYFTANNLAAAATGIGTGAGGTTAPATSARFTAYFKKQITVPEDYQQTFLRILADDGAVVYVDGVERTRINMTGTNPNVPGNGSGDTYTMGADTFTNETITADLPLGSLTAGPHVIALSLHNQIVTPASSDLGLYVQLFGSSLPPPIMLRTEFGGVFVGVTADAPLGTGGWELDSPPRSFSLTGNGASTLNSAPINLSAVGEVHFTAQLFIFEGSATSNFEVDDSFSAKLEITRDDDTIVEVNLLPDDLDINLDRSLTGDELNPGLPAVEDATFFGRQLRAVIPADAKSVRVLVSGDNDSTSEEFTIGGLLISDVPPGSDTDGDGMAREAEMFAQTDPDNPQSVFRIKAIERSFDDAMQEYVYTLTYPGVINMWYTIEYSRDGAVWKLFGFSRPTTTNPDRVLQIRLTPTQDPGDKIMIRMRAVP